METQISETEIETSLRSLILTEESKALEVKEVLARVLEHYNTSVHYR
jgi:hypothetical protein